MFTGYNYCKLVYQILLCYADTLVEEPATAFQTGCQTIAHLLKLLGLLLKPANNAFATEALLASKFDEVLLEVLTKGFF